MSNEVWFPKVNVELTSAFSWHIATPLMSAVSSASKLPAPLQVIGAGTAVAHEGNRQQKIVARHNTKTRFLFTHKFI